MLFLGLNRGASPQLSWLWTSNTSHEVQRLPQEPPDKNRSFALSHATVNQDPSTRAEPSSVRDTSSKPSGAPPPPGGAARPSTPAEKVPHKAAPRARGTPAVCRWRGWQELQLPFPRDRPEVAPETRACQKLHREPMRLGENAGRWTLARYRDDGHPCPSPGAFGALIPASSREDAN